jgi:hypothetical protein
MASRTLMDRRKHPDYTSITAHVPKAMARRLKALVAFNDMTISEAIEQALIEWMDRTESPTSGQPQPQPQPPAPPQP